jgi:hypothetical protein
VNEELVPLSCERLARERRAECDQDGDGFHVGCSPQPDLINLLLVRLLDRNPHIQIRMRDAGCAVG